MLGQSLKRAAGKDWRLELRGQSLKRTSGKDWRLEMRGQSLKRAAGKDWRQGLEAGIGGRDWRQGLGRWAYNDEEGAVGHPLPCSYIYLYILVVS